MSVLVAATTKADVHALAFQGIMAYASFPQIRDMLLRKFGDESVLYFAKPVENSQSGIIDWYSPVQGAPQKIIDLPEEQRQSALAKAEAMTKEIGTWAQELMKSPDPLKVTRGNILNLALHCPDENYIYVIGEQPVFVCWGFAPGTPGVEPVSLTRLLGASPRPAPVQNMDAPAAPAQAPPPPVTPVAPVAANAAGATAAAPRSRGWIWWLLPLLALLLLICVLCTSFGGLPSLAGPVWLHGPALPFMDKKEDKSGEIAILERELRELEGKVYEHAALCKPEKAIPPIAEAPATPHVPAAPVQPKQELVIPRAAQDASFMKGKWYCESGLANKATSEPIQFEFSFDASGNGQGVVYEKNDRCVGAARAAMRNGQLHLSLGRAQCLDGHSYTAVEITCEANASGDTTCYGVNEDGTRWEAPFVRIR